MADPAILGEITTSPEEWHARFMGVADYVKGWSKDPNNQVGAVVVVDKGRSMSPGYNGFPPGVMDLKQRLKGPEKNKLTVHAESNALDNADFDIRGGTIYVTRFPCLPCALRIISRGISHVVAPAPEPGSSWLNSQQEAQAILGEVNIRITLVEATDANPATRGPEAQLGS